MAAASSTISSGDKGENWLKENQFSVIQQVIQEKAGKVTVISKWVKAIDPAMSFKSAQFLEAFRVQLIVSSPHNVGINQTLAFFHDEMGNYRYALFAFLFK